MTKRNGEVHPATLLAVMLGLCLTQMARAAAPTADQQRKLAAADRLVLLAGEHYQQGEFAESGRRMGQAVKIIEGLYTSGKQDEVDPLTGELRRRVDIARRLLKSKGVSVPQIRISDPAAKAKPDHVPVPGKNPAKTPPSSVSFIKHVAPILISKCSRCHIDQTRGGLSMATFDSLAKGSDAGAVIMPGKGQGSRIIELLENGDMPRGGGRVTKEQIATLARWIDEGARFDGTSRSARLTDLAPGVKSDGPAALQVMPATGREKVLFSRDVAPILAANCRVCHGGSQPRARLSMDTFARFLKGGDGGPPLMPGKPGESLIVQKLKGTAKTGKRMPINKGPLSSRDVSTIETWISEGAKFDAPDAEQPLLEVIALSQARRADHGELSRQRAKVAEGKWRLAVPDAKAKVVQTEGFLIYGDLDDQTLAGVRQSVERQSAAIAGLLKLPAGQPLVKGRQTIYAFRQRFNYSEFGQMVEKRQLPPSWRGHWGYNTIDAYGCLLLPKADEYTLDALAAQQIAGAYVASLGTSPRWFSEGSARALAARLHPKDPRVAAWNERLASLAGGRISAADFLTAGKLPPEDADVLAYGFVKNLAKNWSRYAKLLAELRQSASLDAALATVYRKTPQELAAGR